MPNTREKLIELCRTTCTPANCHSGTGYDRRCYECVADHLIANGVTVQKWIPVSERLPEANVAVLVYDGKTVDGYTFYDLLYVSKYGVTHWMPLPDAPKEGEADG